MSILVLDREYKEYQELKEKTNKAIETLKDTSVDMPSTLLMETIDYAIHILEGSDSNE